MKTLRVAIVDDEPLAREGLRIRLARLPGVEIVAESGNAIEAVAMLNTLRPDAVLLDIQMPELDGFGLLARLDRGPLPVGIFVTAHADQALKAFRAGALDYLVKPFDDDTLRDSVERARAYVAMVGRQPAPDPELDQVKRLTVKSNGKMLFVAVSDLDWVESAGDQVRLHVRGQSYVYTSTMRDLETALPSTDFVRVHRTALVALRMIKGLEPYSAGEHLVVLADGTKIPLSRRSRAKVVAAIGG